jgi:cell division protein FtsW
MHVVGLVGVPLAFLFITEKDLGTTFVTGACLFALLYLSGVNRKILGTLLIGGIALICFFAFGGSDFRSERFVYTNPWDDGAGGYGSGYNIIRSYYAIASGGVFGNGIGGSHEKYDYLYAADNDFIFAIICEEMGLIGGLVVILCILTIFVCCIKIASVQSQMENKLVLYGTGLLLVIQSLLNIGCTVGVLPTTGKPLPFVSSGGSSVIASFIMLGVILNAVTHSEVVTRADRKRSKINIYSNSEVEPDKNRSRGSRNGQERSGGRTRQRRSLDLNNNLRPRSSRYDMNRSKTR